MMKALINSKEIEIRFNEVDSMGIVWHGSYVQYFEDGREAFGKQYDLGYLDIFGAGYYAPLVNLHFSFKKPLVYGDRAIVQTQYIPCDAAKIIFDYEIRHAKTRELIATGRSEQVFLNKEFQLELYSPCFYTNWKKQNGLC